MRTPMYCCHSDVIIVIRIIVIVFRYNLNLSNTCNFTRLNYVLYTLDVFLYLYADVIR